MYEPHLLSVEIKPEATDLEFFPFNTPLIQSFEKLNFDKPITFFVGENGTGKSTILEAMAAGIGSITIGGDDVTKDPTLENARKLAEKMKFTWNIKTRKGFFLRAEDVFGFSRHILNTSQELQEMADVYDKSLTGYGRQLAMGSVLGQKSSLKKKYGENLDANSHGETFLKIFQSRFVPGGLYLMDEPETPLSFNRQLSLIVMLREMVKQDAQFIIATHSPILAALPEAQIFSFDKYPIKEIDYEKIEQFSLMKDFLNDPQIFLKHLE